ncbi:hypothetical protein D5086_021060 [Populus alba]|uniref:Uncharacterized protein n=1 Tax=Populus alba TaxID=43335 RepID=A0ACC4BMM3_POPAL
MKPVQPPPPQPLPSTNRHTNNSRPRRRPDLKLPLPQRDPQLAVPLPLPPNSGGSNSSSSSARAQLSFSELDRINRIGRGSGGTVYKVVHRPTNRLYALKVIYGNHEDSVRNSICREIEILRDVNHPNVVKCHDMFDHNGEIQIADFGVSRILAQTMDPCNSSVGTIAYMSPERINTDLNKGMYDGYAGDIWSLGVSILEFYLGRFPFGVGRQGDWASLMCAICMSQPPEAPATASMEFRDFIACCLQREPARRFTANQLLQHPFIVRRAGEGSGGNGTHSLMLPPPPRPIP